MNKNLLSYLANTKVLLVASIVYIFLSIFLSNVILTLILSLYDFLTLFLKDQNVSIANIGITSSSILEFKPKYYWFYIGMFALNMWGLIRTVYKLKKNYGNINKGQRGTSEFTTLPELKKQYRAVPEKDKEYPGNGGVVISRYKDTIFIDDNPVNNLIIGTTRSGKGETFVVPTIDVYSRAEKKPSLIVNDPKGELAAASYETLKKRGYEVLVLNLLNPKTSLSYNPLQLIIDSYKNGDYSTAQQLTRTVAYTLYNDPTAKDKFWQSSAMSLFSAIVLAITADSLKKGKEEQITLYSVANFLANLGEKEDLEGNNELDNFFQRRPATDPAKLQYATSNFAKGSTRGGIFSSTMDKLQIFTDENNAKMTSKNTIDLEEIGFGEKPIAVFMVTPDYDSSNHVLASIFVRQLYYVLAKKATISRGGKCTREVVFLLDEFGNMPAIEGMSNIITVCLGRNIKFNLIIQAYSQLKKLYGEDADTIIGNCGNQIYILTNDLSTAEHFSKLVGNETIVDISRSGQSLSFEKNHSESNIERPLLTPNELMSLKEQESVVVRVIKRQDLKREKIKPKPIYNHDKTQLKARWQYLSDTFDTSKSVNNLPIIGEHIKVKLEDIVFGTRTHKDKYSKIIDSFTPGELEEISNILHEKLSADMLETYTKFKDSLTILQFAAFITHAKTDFQHDELTLIKETIKPYFSIEEWEKWDRKLDYIEKRENNVFNFGEEEENIALEMYGGF
ncbi:type IV secretory system conjugative DNA transfer family protein [Margalitia sp. FSL K6-0131]|uniref:VirD4-like conjugal transfer protein, CD1115 family n=1 Tax=Margalitia sp. FSL K6-0131 TaxID=2954604 RepID=UPI0030F7BD07